MWHSVDGTLSECARANTDRDGVDVPGGQDQSESINRVPNGTSIELSSGPSRAAQNK